MRTRASGLSVHGLSKIVGGRYLWENVTFDVAPGEMVALTGPSGCGKSTLLNCIGLLERPTSGAILVGGERIHSISERHRRRLYRDEFGFLFQNFGLVENWTVRQNLDVVRRRSKRTSVATGIARAEALAAVGVRASERARIHTLSGGEQQRIAFARLILKQPAIVLADEPTAALDRGNGSLITVLLRRMCDRGASVVVSTHDDAVAASADRIVVLARA